MVVAPERFSRCLGSFQRKKQRCETAHEGSYAVSESLATRYISWRLFLETTVHEVGDCTVAVNILRLLYRFFFDQCYPTRLPSSGPTRNTRVCYRCMGQNISSGGTCVSASPSNVACAGFSP